MINKNIIGGKYRLKHKIGEGAMGVVWAALNQQTSREVAVKLISSSDEQLRQRLIREACTCGQLSHRNIIEVLDAGTTEDGDPYLVMPLLVGEPLADLLNRKRRLDAPIVAQIARDIAKALTAAHAANVVHRDLKPANIFLHKEAGSDGTVVKVMDFGICKRLESKDEKLTATGKVIGSPSYMSPEQFSPEKGIDHRTDIWSLGIIMFEMLTGERPFQGDRMKVILNIIDADVEIPRVSRLVRFVPQALVDIVAGCLMRERDQRIGSAAELFEMLQAIASPGDAVGIYSEASRRTSAPSSVDLLSREALKGSGSPEAAFSPVFPRTLNDSSVITLPRESGPRKPAARRRLAATPLAQVIEGELSEVGESESDADERTQVAIGRAHRAMSAPGGEVDDTAATTPLSIRDFVRAEQTREERAWPPGHPTPAPQRISPTTATPAQEDVRYNEPRSAGSPQGDVASTPPSGPTWAHAIPLSGQGLIHGVAPPAVRASADSIGALTGAMWAPRRARVATSRALVSGAMALIASSLLVWSLVTATMNPPPPAPALAESAILKLVQKLGAAQVDLKPAVEPADSALPSPPSTPPPKTKKRGGTTRHAAPTVTQDWFGPAQKSASFAGQKAVSAKSAKAVAKLSCSKKSSTKC